MDQIPGLEWKDDPTPPMDPKEKQAQTIEDLLNISPELDAVFKETEGEDGAPPPEWAKALAKGAHPIYKKEALKPTPPTDYEKDIGNREAMDSLVEQSRLTGEGQSKENVSELASDPMEVQKVLDYQRRYLKDLEDGKIKFMNEDPDYTGTLGAYAIGFDDKVTIFGEGANKQLWYTVKGEDGKKERRYIKSEQLSAEAGTLKEIEELTALANQLEATTEVVSKKSVKTKGWETTLNTNRDQVVELRKEVQGLVESLNDISKPADDNSWKAASKKDWSDKAVQGEIMRVKKIIKRNKELMKDVHGGGRK